jgi:hypothetical protein
VDHQLSFDCIFNFAEESFGGTDVQPEIPGGLTNPSPKRRLSACENLDGLIQRDHSAV